MSEAFSGLVLSSKRKQVYISVTVCKGSRCPFKFCILVTFARCIKNAMFTSYHALAHFGFRQAGRINPINSEYYKMGIAVDVIFINFRTETVVLLQHQILRR